MTAPILLQMTAPMRDNFAIPYHDIGNPDRHPRIALVAGLHGDELNGVFVLSRLAGFLKDVYEGKSPQHRLLHRVVIIPAVNILGINTRSRTWPFDKTDVNRMFPGIPTGETTQRIAHAVVEATRLAYYRVDIHSSNRGNDELPQVRLYEPTNDERSSAFLFELPAIVERPSNTVFTTTIGHTWRTLGGENFVIQAGHAPGLQLHHCERLFRALVSFLIRTDILGGVDLSGGEEDVHYFPVEQSFPLISNCAGLFVSNLEVGRWIQAGETVGIVYDGFNGTIDAEIKAPVSGLLSGLRRQPLLCEGDLVATILNPDTDE